MSDPARMLSGVIGTLTGTNGHIRKPDLYYGPRFPDRVEPLAHYPRIVYEAEDDNRSLEAADNRCLVYFAPSATILRAAILIKYFRLLDHASPAIAVHYRCDGTTTLPQDAIDYLMRRPYVSGFEVCILEPAPMDHALLENP